ncbi:TPA: hypothetical protein DCE37_20150 [Candidatus Latescibacteria bacterium]|nr:hypothetical protein [Candidatus Latescibacterota bacterium]
MEVSPANSNIWLLGTEELRACLSSNGGQSWSLVEAGDRAAFVRRFRFSLHDPLRVLAATEGNRIFVSDYTGQNWEGIGSEVIMDFSRDVVFHPTDSRVVFSAPANTDVLLRRSDNQGETWSDSGANLYATVTSLAIGTTDPGFVYAGNRGQPLRQSGWRRFV